MFVLLVLLVAAARNTLGIASASSQHITKIEQYTFLRYLCSRCISLLNIDFNKTRVFVIGTNKAGSLTRQVASKAGRLTRQVASKAGELTRQVG
jgi:hypothetical protein